MSKRTRLNLVKREVVKSLDNTTVPDKTIGSFDIGIKNLSLCILDYHPTCSPSFKVHRWDLISLVDQVGTSPLKCKHKMYPRTKKEQEEAKRGRGSRGWRYCGAKASWWNESSRTGYCGTHYRSYGDLSRYTTTRNVTDMELNRTLIERLNEIPALWERCDQIVIESQKTSKMKKIVFMIMSFLTHQTVLHGDSRLKRINVVSASHKLAMPIGKLNMEGLELPDVTEKGLTRATYDGRKELGKLHCTILLKNDATNLEYFNSQKKQDDLADSFLQGLCYLVK